MILLATTVSSASCSANQGGSSIMTLSNEITDAEWQRITTMRVLFGHQSVGNNILEGVRSLAAEAGRELNLVETRSAPTAPGIYHFKVGCNEEPQSKIDDFAQTLEGGAASGADVALMKLCYIDFTANTDAVQLAANYSTSLDQLSQTFPATRFVAVTSPLTTVQGGWKATIKRLLGRTPSGYAENASREKFNQILRERYGRDGRLFDLAAIEAETAAPHNYQKKPLATLDPAISSDGGHLNQVGQRLLANRLLKFLAALPMH
jgi:hypothetical protein